jgi:hypothetical protein
VQSIACAALLSQVANGTLSSGVLAAAIALGTWGLVALGESDLGQLEASCCDDEVNFGFSEHAIKDGPLFAGIIGLDEGCMAREGEVVATAVLGEVNVKRLFVNILSNLSGGDHVQGWSLGLRLEGEGAIIRATVAGTAADAMPHGYRDPEGSFNKTLVIDPAKNAGVRGVVTAVSLTTQGLEEAVLPSVGTQSVLAFDVSTQGSQGEMDQIAVLQFGINSPQELVVVEGSSAYACNASTARMSVIFRARQPRFYRGDANASSKVDISDAIRIFMTLFQGADPFPCADAADATDDGRTDISDGLRILLDFFVPDTAIPAPGPFTCGPDPARPMFLVSLHFGPR